MIRNYFNWQLAYGHAFFKQSIIFSLLTCISLGAFAQQQKNIGSVSEFKKYIQISSVQQLSKVSRVRILKTNGSDLKAIINTSKSENGSDVISGQIDGSQSSNVYFKFTNGKLEGTVVDPKFEKAYRYSSDNSGNTFVIEEDIHKVVCIKYEDAEAAAQTAALEVEAAPPVGSAAYQLQSLPGSASVVYLDFDGQVVTSSRWNGGNTINAAPANVTDADITAIWKAISEDYKPFNVNITTDESVFLAAAKGKRMRCIFTPTSSWYGSAGGVAYVNSFTWTDDTPCWAFYFSQKIGAEVGSHEVGHTLGLSHDGRTTPVETYYGGQGNWAPIMGVSYYKSLTQWSKGEYQYANQTQDDVSIISSKVAYMADEAGNTNATAKALALSASGAVLTSNAGIITMRTDIDVYSFTTSGGSVSLTVNPATVSPNLDVLLKLTNSTGTVLVTSDPSTTLYASLTTTLTAGTYYLQIDGTGYLNPVTTGYSDYASIGEYIISGTVPVSAGNQLPTVSITSPTSGASFTAPASVTINAMATDTDGTISKVEFYNGTILLNTDNTSPYSFVWSSVAVGTYTLTAKAYDNASGVSTSSSVSITVNSATNQLPTVSITSPTSGASFTAPASVTINATATDADGTISKVEFYNGTILLGTDNSSPYSYSWTNVAAGSYSITAKAYDNLNATKTSSTVTIAVNSTSICSAPQWNASTAYWANDVVQYSGIKYKANWWTQNNRPDLNNGGVGSGQPWTSLGPCTAKMSAMEVSQIETTLTVYPNPANESLTIQMEGIAESIEVIGTDGKLYIKEKGTSSINVSSLESGLYLIKIQIEGTTFMRRFSKQ